MATVLDRLIGYLAPERALRRAQARAATGLVLRSYEGARPNGDRDGWIAPGTSANAAIGPNLIRLRSNARDLVRNNPYAARAVAVWVGHVIGDGITGRPRVGGEAEGVDEAASARLADTWRRWAETTECDADGQHDLFGLQALACRAQRESGEVLVRLRTRQMGDGLTVPLQLQILEGDQLDTSRFGRNGANRIVYGVELDPIGRRVAYWLFPDHPGDAGYGMIPRALTSQRVPADQVLHVYRKQRPGQLRGVPDLAPVIQTLVNLGDYHHAQLVRAKIEACLAAFVTTPEQPGESPLAPTSTNAQGERVEEFRPGMVTYLRPGETVETSEPTGSGGHADFSLSSLQATAVGTGLTYDQIAGDLRQANYSSLRAGKTEMRRLVSQDQWHMWIPMFCEPIARAFLARGVETGAFDAVAGRARFQWAPHPAEQVDPLKDTTAELIAIRSGLTTLGQAIQARGYDPREHLAEIAGLNEQIDDLALTLDSDPRRVSKAGVTNAPPANGAPADPADSDD